ADLRRPRDAHGGAEVAQRVGRVGIAPAVAMVGVVLRPVHERVEPMRAHEADDVAPRVVAPRATVVPLDDAAKQWTGSFRHEGGGSKPGRTRLSTIVVPRPRS